MTGSGIQKNRQPKACFPAHLCAVGFLKGEKGEENDV